MANTVAKRHFQAPAWVDVPMFVWIRYDEAKGTALRCVVAGAAGHHARVVNPGKNIDRWLHIDQLLVPPGDRHTRKS